MDRENNFAQFDSVNPVVRAHNAITEVLANLIETRFPWFEQLATNNVGIDDWHVQFGKQVTQRGLACCDAPGESDRKHQDAG